TEFELEHKTLIQQIMTLAERVQDLEDSLAKQKGVREQHDRFVQKRKLDVEELQKNIANARKAAEVAIARQSELEKQTFDAERSVTTADQKNQELERTLKAMESGR